MSILPVWLVPASSAAATFYDGSGGSGLGGLEQTIGVEVALRLGSGVARPGIGLVARGGVLPSARSPNVELGWWLDVRTFLRSGVEVGLGPSVSYGGFELLGFGYYPIAAIGVRGGPTLSSRWGFGIRGAAEVRGLAFLAAGVEATHLFGVRDDTIPLTTLPTLLVSADAPLLLNGGVPGRPLRVGAGWLLAPALRGLGGAALEWYDRARGEHASVPAFARLARELAALAAPRTLVRWAERAAGEEVGHAATCLALASRHAGRRLSLGPVAAPPPRRPSWEVVAAEARVDGVEGEGGAALEAAAAAAAATDAAEARAWATIAREEARHADLAAAILHQARRASG